MASPTADDLPATGEQWRQCERIVRRFEEAWRRGERPDIESFLPPDGPLREAVLLELVLTDLELRLEAGEEARVEPYLTRFPQLTAQPDRLLELIVVEINHRRRQGEVPLSEYRQRFPLLQDQLTVRLAKDATEPGARPRPAPRDGGLPVITGYEVIEELGRGGMGVVFKARQVALDRVVALKMIRDGQLAGGQELARFRAEAEAVAAVHHPGIVQVFDFGTCKPPGGEELPYLALEYCLGGTLAARLGGKPLPPREGGGIVKAVAQAVQAAHDRGVVHRDLKPANVLFDAAGAPKVTDFGLARRAGGGPRLTGTGALLGTPSYMAPEQARGENEVGPAADVYALGAILYECLTGRPPFLSATAIDTALQVVSEEPVPPRQLNAQVPRDVETICLKCLHKEPARRYASARELADDLRRWEAGEPIVARPVGTIERAVKWARRRPAITALLTAIVVGVGVAFWALRAEQLRTALERDRALAAEKEAKDNFEQARNAEKEANDNFEQARKAVDECFGLAKDDPVLQAEHLRQIRQLLLKKTLPFYQSFIRRSPDDPKLAAQHASYLYRVAFITQVIGNRTEAITIYEQVRDILIRLREAHRGATDYAADLAQTYNELGVLLRQTGKPQEALRNHEQALGLLQALRKAHPKDAETQVHLASTYNHRGVLFRETLKYQEALVNYARARDVQQRLSQAHPRVVRYQAHLAMTNNNLGVLHRAMGQPREAMLSYQQAKDIQGRLTRLAPDVAEHQADLARTCHNLGVLLRQVGKTEEAMLCYTQAKDLRASLTVRFPEVTDYQADLARTYSALGVLQRQAGQPQDALASYARARGIAGRLSKAHPEVYSYQFDLAAVCNNLSVLQGQSGQLRQAVTTTTEARDVLVRLSKARPQVTRYKAELAASYHHLSYLQRELGHFEDACHSGAQAISLLRAVLQREPEDSRCRAMLPGAYGRRALALRNLGRPRDAIADWDEYLRLTASSSARIIPGLHRAAALAQAGDYREANDRASALPLKGPPSGVTLYLVARVKALSAGAASRDATRPLPERAKFAETWAQQAVESLRRAEKAGHFKQARNVNQLKKDKDLDFLRSRGDFQRWLAEVSD